MSRHSGARAKRANPESITTIVSMDSGSAPSGASRNDEGVFLTRRRLLVSAAAGLVPALAYAQAGTKPPPKLPSPNELAPAAPLSIEVNARPIPSFDTRDRARTRFGALEYRSGLILTSS